MRKTLQTPQNVAQPEPGHKVYEKSNFLLTGFWMARSF